MLPGPRPHLVSGSSGHGRFYPPASEPELQLACLNKYVWRHHRLSLAFWFHSSTFWMSLSPMCCTCEGSPVPALSPCPSHLLMEGGGNLGKRYSHYCFPSRFPPITVAVAAGVAVVIGIVTVVVIANNFMCQATFAQSPFAFTKTWHSKYNSYFYFPSDGTEFERCGGLHSWLEVQGLSSARGTPEPTLPDVMALGWPLAGKRCSSNAKETRDPAVGPDQLLTEANIPLLGLFGDCSAGEGLHYGGREDKPILKQTHTDLLQEESGNEPYRS